MSWKAWLLTFGIFKCLSFSWTTANSAPHIFIHMPIVITQESLPKPCVCEGGGCIAEHSGNGLGGLPGRCPPPGPLTTHTAGNEQIPPPPPSSVSNCLRLGDRCAIDQRLQEKMNSLSSMSARSVQCLGGLGPVTDDSELEAEAPLPSRQASARALICIQDLLGPEIGGGPLAAR